MGETSGMANPGPKRAWPHLEAEMRNHFQSGPPPPLLARDGDQRLPYSTQDLPAWQVEIIDRFSLLYRCPAVGRADYCHLQDGFACGQEWVPVIRDMSEMAEALVRALRSSVQPEAKIAVAEVIEVNGCLRWRINYNIPPPFRDFIHDYF